MQAIGQLFLGGVQFTTDPSIYRPFARPRRYSVQEGLMGSVTIQDFGRFAADGTVHIESGQGQFMSQECVDDLDALHDVDGATYTLTDWMDNEYVVFITAFEPVPTNLPDRDEDDDSIVGTLYTYSMDLRVVSITKIRGQAYGGD